MPTLALFLFRFARLLFSGHAAVTKQAELNRASEAVGIAAAAIDPEQILVG
jgi:hypothetical protein